MWLNTVVLMLLVCCVVDGDDVADGGGDVLWCTHLLMDGVC